MKIKNRDLPLLLHASSVEISGKALVFLGHSTAGKSTISKILSKKYRVISDDKIALYTDNEGKWVVKNGDEKKIGRQLQEKISFPTYSYQILSFVRIFKSDSNKITNISSSELCKHLTDAVFEVDNQRKNNDLQSRKEWFHIMADLSKKSTGWNLHFKKNSSITTIISKTFE